MGSSRGLVSEFRTESFRRKSRTCKKAWKIRGRNETSRESRSRPWQSTRGLHPFVATSESSPRRTDFELVRRVSLASICERHARNAGIPGCSRSSPHAHEPLSSPSSNSFSVSELDGLRTFHSRAVNPRDKSCSCQNSTIHGLTEGASARHSRLARSPMFGARLALFVACRRGTKTMSYPGILDLRAVDHGSPPSATSRLLGGCHRPRTRSPGPVPTEARQLKVENSILRSRLPKRVTMTLQEPVLSG